MKENYLRCACIREIEPVVAQLSMMQTGRRFSWLTRSEEGSFWGLNELSVVRCSHFFSQLCQYALHRVLTLPTYQHTELLCFHLANFINSWMWLHIFPMPYNETPESQNRKRKKASNFIFLKDNVMPIKHCRNRAHKNNWCKTIR